MFEAISADSDAYLWFHSYCSLIFTFHPESGDFGDGGIYGYIIIAGGIEGNYVGGGGDAIFTPVDGIIPIVVISPAVPGESGGGDVDGAEVAGIKEWEDGGEGEYEGQYGAQYSSCFPGYFVFVRLGHG